MAGINDGVGLLFRIKTDGSQQAAQDIHKVGAAAEQMAAKVGVTSQQFGDVKTAVASLTVAFTALAAEFALVAIVTTKVAESLFNLAKSTSEYGAKIFAATQQTGLSAEAISALKFAADTSGLSLENVAGAVGKFNALLGEAATGSEKAQATLEKYNITAKDANEAFQQAITTIAALTDQELQSAAAKALFKDEVGKILPLIKSFNGDLPGLIEKLRTLGITLTDIDAAASDAFAVALRTLTTQAEATGRQFALGFMPNITHAMKDVSESLGNNAQVARAWGQAVGNVIDGVVVAWRGGAGALTGLLDMIGLGFLRAGKNAEVAAQMMIGVLSPLAGIMGLLGRGAPLTGQVGGTFNPPPSINIPSIGKGGGAGGGGGQAKADEDKVFQEAQKRQEKLLDLYQDSADRRVAEADLSLQKMEISEIEHAHIVAKIALDGLEFERKINEQLLSLESITADKKEEILHKLDRIRTQISTQRLKSEKDISKEVMDAFAAWAQEMEDYDRLSEEFHKKAVKRANELANLRTKTQLDPNEKDRIRLQNDLNLSILGDSILSVRNDAGNLVNTIKPILPVLQLGGQALEQFAQGLGNVVQNLVLMGTVGPNAMRKLVASVLAGVSAQAAVMAIMELAYGIAALTPWGFALYGDPTKHFHAAALFGTVAVATGLAGRAVAGNAFSQQTGAATGGGATGNSSDNDRTNFGSRFNGFAQQNKRIEDAINRLTMGLSQNEETLHDFKEHFGVASPGDVVMRGAVDAAGAIHGATQGYLSDNPGATGAYKRNFGDAR